jgi:hypothetical protein
MSNPTHGPLAASVIQSRLLARPHGHRFDEWTPTAAHGTEETVKGKDIVFALRDALVAEAKGSPQRRALADALFELMAAVPWSAPDGEPNAELAFDLFVRHLEALEGGALFEPAMLTGEVLAACALNERSHAALIQRWTERARPGPRLGALRACSKLCEYDTSLIELGVLQRLAERDDLDATTLGYLAQVAGRLRGEDKGVALIERLSGQGAERRVLAAHAITYAVAMDPPFAKLSVFEQFGPSRLESRPPSRRLLRLLVGLLDDPAPEVAQAANQAAETARLVWPEMNKLLADVLQEVLGLPQAAPSAAGKANPAAVDFALNMPARMGERHGKLIWDLELIAEERADARAGTPLPRALGAPRLFLSYRWADGPYPDLTPYETAGTLHMRGYDLVFDRDPRHVDSGRTADDVLGLMEGCTHFVGCINEELSAYFAVSRQGPEAALDREWALAQRLALRSPGVRPFAFWFDGETLPANAQGWPIVDLRSSYENLDALLPPCQFEIHTFDAGGQRLFRSPPLKRRALRASYVKERNRPAAARIEIHDVTARPLLDRLYGP